MKKALLTLLVMSLSTPIEAAPVKHIQHRRAVVSHHRGVHHPQQHYSFLPMANALPKPVATKAPLTGQVLTQTRLAEPIPPKPSMAVAVPQPFIMPLMTKKHAWFFHRHFRQTQVVGKNDSTTVSMNATEAAQLSTQALELLKSQSQNNATFLLLPPVPDDKQGNTFTPSLTHALQAEGFQVVSEATPSAIPVRYRISKFKNSYLLNVKINGVQMARLYERQDGNVIAASPLSTLKEQP
jgi:hypothetical protein